MFEKNRVLKNLLKKLNKTIFWNNNTENNMSTFHIKLTMI